MLFYNLTFFNFSTYVYFSKTLTLKSSAEIPFRSKYFHLEAKPRWALKRNSHPMVKIHITKFGHSLRLLGLCLVLWVNWIGPLG